MKTTNILKVLEYVIENEAHHYAETIEDNPSAAKTHIYAIALQALDDLTHKPAPKPKADALPANWQGNGRYKLYDASTKAFFEADFEGACIHKGLTPKKMFKVAAMVKDRPKHFNDGELARCAANNWISQYVNHWLSLNNLKRA
jgi:hypothetical protein